MTCRVLKIARRPYYRWLAAPVTDAEWVEAHRANALFEAHRDDPEFGYQFLADEACQEGQDIADDTVIRSAGRATMRSQGVKRKNDLRSDGGITLSVSEPLQPLS